VESDVRLLSAGRALALLVVAPALAFAAAVEERLPADHPLLRNPHFDIWVVSIVDVRAEGATNANPPTARVVVEDVLRGGGPRGPATAVWRGATRAADFEPAEPGRAGQLKPEWKTRPLPGPTPRDRLIVFGRRVQDGSLGVESWAVFRDTLENRQMARRAMAPAERSGWVQGPVALALLAAPVVALLLLRRGRRRRWNYVLAPAAAGLYAFYESGISLYTNIRVDLLLIYPALAATALAMLVTLILDVIAIMRRSPA
jgi:hypothetical protein